MDTYLVFCPSADPAMPHAALPALGTALRDHDAGDYSLRDLNLEAFLYYLSPNKLAEARNVIEQRLGSGGYDEPERAREAESVLRDTTGLEERIDGCLRGLRNPESFYDCRTFLCCKRDVTRACRLVSLQYDTVEFGKYSLYERFKYDNFAQVEAALAHPDSRMMREFYQDEIISDLQRDRPLLVGIPVAYLSQLIPSFILASEIRSACPDTHIAMGGPVVAWGQETMTRESRQFSTLIDSFCVGEGDECVVQLVKQLKKKGSLDATERLVWFQDGDAVTCPVRSCELELKSITNPDYPGIPLDRYLAPERILSVPLTKGCYYNVCKFCNYSFIRSTPYRERPMELVVQDIQRIVASTGERVFSFESDVIRPAYLREFSLGLLNEGLDIRWHGVMRFEGGLDGEFFTTLAEAGCVRMYLGMESGNQRLLDEMKKGTDVAVIAQTLRLASAAGIATEIGVFFGYPGETVAEASDTLEFVRSNRSFIDRADVGLFRLLKGAPVEAELRQRRGCVVQSPENYWFTVDFHDPYFEEHKEAFQDILGQTRRMYPILQAMDISEEILYVAKYGRQVIRLVEEEFLKEQSR